LPRTFPLPALSASGTARHFNRKKSRRKTPLVA
jgi:hypothetical protein